MQRFDFIKEIFGAEGRGRDIGWLIFRDYLDHPSRASLGITARSNLRYFNDNKQMALCLELQKRLKAEKLNVDINHLKQLNINAVYYFLYLVECPFALKREKIDFIKLIAGNDCQLIDNIHYWRIFICMTWIIMGIDLNPKDKSYQFINDNNIHLFKELVVKLDSLPDQYKLTSVDIDDEALPPPPAFNEFDRSLNACCASLAQANEISLSESLQCYLNENYYLHRNITETTITHYQKSKKQLEEFLSTHLTAVESSLDYYFDHLDKLFSEDKRGFFRACKIISSMDDKYLLHNYYSPWSELTGINETNDFYTILASIFLNHTKLIEKAVNKFALEKGAPSLHLCVPKRYKNGALLNADLRISAGIARFAYQNNIPLAAIGRILSDILTSNFIHMAFCHAHKVDETAYYSKTRYPFWDNFPSIVGISNLFSFVYHLLNSKLTGWSKQDFNDCSQEKLNSMATLIAIFYKSECQFADHPDAIKEIPRDKIEFACQIFRKHSPFWSLPSSMQKELLHPQQESELDINLLRQLSDPDEITLNHHPSIRIKRAAENNPDAEQPAEKRARFG